MNIQNIQFKGVLFDAFNDPVAGMPCAIQFYNVFTTSWMTLTEEFEVAESKVLHVMAVPERISTTDQTIRVVREVLRSGGVPNFRLVKVDDRYEIPSVIATDFEVMVDAEKELLSINFEQHWLLPEDQVIHETSHRVIARAFQVEATSADMTAIIQERDALQQQVQDLQAAMNGLAKENEMLRREYEMAQQSLQATEQQVKDLQTTVDDLKGQLESVEPVDSENYKEKYYELEQQYLTLQGQYENQKKENEALLSGIRKLQETIKTSQSTIALKDQQLEAQKQQVASLEQKVQQYQKDLEVAADYSALDHPNKLSASKVYSSIVNDVIKADAELANANYKLSNVSLNIKTTVENGPQGTLLGLIDFDSAKDINGAAISDISIDIVPNAGSVNTNAPKMPNVKGLTETAVRRILSDHGLKLDAVYHATDDPALTEGQSFKQSPLPDADIREGQEVIVIFAKPIK